MQRTQVPAGDSGGATTPRENMSKADEFTPKLGRPGDRGGAAGKRFASRVKRAVKRLAKPKGKAGFSGVRSGRGVAAARIAEMRRSPFAKFRMRRVVVKVHIARAAQGIGKAAFRAHVKYIQRDGVDRAEGGDDYSDERRAGRLYSKDADRLDDESFLARSEDDRHQFRIIVSLEDGDALGLKDNTRALMAQMERDLGTRLDWVAVDHHNTGHPHTHIVIRGKDQDGKDLVIARDYLTQGLRAQAQGIVMERLGPRRDMEIARARSSEVACDRLTGLDRRLGEIERDGLIAIGGATGGHDRFERTLRLRRLSHLEGQGLATRIEAGRWRTVRGWQDRLQDLGKRGELPDRKPAKLTIMLPPDVFSALNDYAAVYQRTYGKREEIEQLAPVMIETFLNTDAAFKRARKDLPSQTGKD